MDSLTHIALGACVGELMLGKKLGKPALLWGAVAQSFPDIDFVASFWMNPANDLLAHRGFTHSFLFIILLTPILALAADRFHRPHNIHMKKWLWFFGVGLLLHIFIDAFNVYGTGWFEPFSHYRVTFNTLFVADIFFSIAPGIALIVLMILKREHKQRKAWAIFGLVIPGIYLLLGTTNKLNIDNEVRTIAAKQQIQYNRYFTTPLPLNNFLWYAVMESDSGYHIGYRSIFDKRETIDFHYFPRNKKLLDSIKDHEDLQHLLRFSQGFYTAEYWHDTLVFNDIRFGQMIGWNDPQAHFVFHYFLSHPDDNDLVVQRGRFGNWSWAALKSLIIRIRGI